MPVTKDTVVTLTYELLDSDGQLIESSEMPVEYLHGGYDGIFPRVEEALAGKNIGEQCRVRLEPEDAFGDYDAELVRMEPRDKFPGNLEVGMRFEGRGEDTGTMVIYTVTDVAEDKVVVDGNHPLAGQTLQFACTVTAVRAATEEELEHGHVHGEGEHHHH
ncbi:MAG TPA: peptidylprolyl isomerase [Burkholderiales bacterium]|jgi:FKBP-type peptidyl-prolyl cis-trans isomerase SlyD|nr:peptidylprolyl isomerase [Burkholderiales bacterium]